MATTTTTTTATQTRTTLIPRSSHSTSKLAPNTTARDDRAERRRLHHEADIVIVGAGVVGCAAAVTFARQGRSVILLEKSLKEPDRIVGELLQPGGVRALEGLGLRDCLEDIDAIPCYGYQVTYHGEPVHIPYSDAANPGVRPEGRSFHHGRFINKLRAAAMREENVMVVESTVVDTVRSGYKGEVLGVECTTGGKKDHYFAPLTLISDGYASKFRTPYLPVHTPIIRSRFWALELHDADLPLPNHGHVILSTAPPILIYQISTHSTRILIDVPTNHPTAAPSAGGIKNHFTNVVLPTLPARLRPSFAEAVERGKFRSMPNSFLPASVQKTPGLIILGDAMNMRHPLTGGGMTVGLNDVLLLSNLLSPTQVPQFENTRQVLAQMRHFHWARKNSTSVINILAMALYSLFAADDSRLLALQNGCFRYFQRGGVCVSEPCGLLAGLITRRAVLVYHFFSVAVYAVWIRLLEAVWWRKPWVLGVEAWLVLWKAVVVIGPYLVWDVRGGWIG